MDNGEVLAFVLYFILMLGIGVFFFFKERGAGEKEYFLGGRSMGPWVTAMSAQASDMSAWLLMGLPGSILAFGFGQIWIGIGLAIGTALNWILVARRLRCFSEAAKDSITLPQYLSNRFATKSLALQIICAVIFLVCFTIYVASAFVSGATVFTTVFPSLSNQTAMLIFAAIMILYTFLGGFKAVCWTDFFQGLLMLVAVLAIPIMIVATEQLDTGLLSKVIVGNDGTEYAFGSSLFTASWKDIASGLAWGLGYFGMPHIIVRFMSIEKASMVKKSATVAIISVVLSLWLGVPDRVLWADAGGGGAAGKRDAEDHLHHAGAAAVPGFHRWRAARGDHGGVHVHGRQPAAGRVQLVHVGHLQACVSARTPRTRRSSGSGVWSCWWSRWWPTSLRRTRAKAHRPS